MRIPPILLGAVGFGAVFAAFAAPPLHMLLAGGEAASAAALRLAGLVVIALGTGLWLAARRAPVPRGAALAVLLLELAWLGASLALLLGLGPALGARGAVVAGFGLALAAAFLVLEARGPRQARP